MPEWWTYGLSDFLMYDRATWWRLVERHNQAAWPLQVPALAGGLFVLWSAWRADLRWSRVGALLLALAWAWVGWSFHWQRHAEISIAAAPFAWTAWFQSLLMLAIAGRAHAGAASGPTHRAGTVLVGLAVLGFPLLAPAAGHPWKAAELFGLMPDPVALATLGWLIALPAVPSWLRWAGSLVPALTLAAGAAMRWAMAQ